ncbi:hypothetical protein [Nonomuraea sp. NPDC049709]|uniref:hypothetical protein n=1 Tax=Nonomuraea sp. NPDC049709 TaxID=3154736 RepID=UPI003420AF0E
MLSILTRTDYLVDDFDEIIAAGRRAYRSIEPDAGEDEVRAEVSDVTGAIYEILHTNGDEVPFPFPGARPITGMIWFLEAGEAMSVEYHNHPVDPFAVAGRRMTDCSTRTVTSTCRRRATSRRWASVGLRLHATRTGRATDS